MLKLKFNKLTFSQDTIVRSLLDTDLYKFTMMQAVFHRYINTEVVVKFKCRDSENLIPYIGAIREQIDAVGDMRFTQDQIWYLEKARFFKKSFTSFLRHFRLDSNQVSVSVVDGEVEITAKGSWIDVILWEIYVLSIVSEVRNSVLYPDVTLNDARKVAFEKIEMFKELSANEDMSGFKLMEFGTRRRFSFAVQWEVIELMKASMGDNFVGTSNVHIAREMNIKAHGTMAHEWLQAHQQLPHTSLRNFQNASLQAWADEYRGDLGIALTDCVSMDAFLKDFDLYFAKLFDGMRHDSGNPIVWGEKAVAHYQKLNIDPKSKILVFSDGLTLPKSFDIYRQFRNRIMTTFGLGTNMSCDIPGVKPMNNVMKIITVNGQPVAKLSDSLGKNMCENEPFVNRLIDTFNYDVK